MPLRTYGLTHVALEVNDLERSLRFYQVLFGLEAARSDGGTVDLRTAGVGDVLTLKQSDGPVDGSGIDALDFRLLEPMSPDSIAIEVTTAGGVVEAKGEYALGEPYVFARDPDGYRLKIWFRQ